MPGGYVARILRVDLTARTLKVESTPEEVVRKYLGGKGLLFTHFINTSKTTNLKECCLQT